MGVKRRRGPRAGKLPISTAPPEPGRPETDPCASTREVVVTFSHETAPYVTTGSPVTLYPKGGAMAVMINAREIGTVTDPALPQLIACTKRGYVYTGMVTDVDSEVLQAKARVSGSRLTE